MKKKWTAAVFAALMLAVSFTAMTACKKEEAPPSEAPEGIGVTVDGVYECDIFDAWDTRVLIVNEDGQRVYIGSGYMNGEGLGATIKVTNYSRESEVAPFPGVAERNSLKYEWKPLGMSYYEWLEALGKASDQAAIDALCVEDYVSLIAYRDGNPVAYFVWKYEARADGANFGPSYEAYNEEVVRTPIVSKEFPLVGGNYQEIDEEWLEDRIETFVDMHREATEQHPA